MEGAVGGDPESARVQDGEEGDEEDGPGCCEGEDERAGWKATEESGG